MHTAILFSTFADEISEAFKLSDLSPFERSYKLPSTNGEWRELEFHIQKILTYMAKQTKQLLTTAHS